MLRILPNVTLYLMGIPREKRYQEKLVMAMYMIDLFNFQNIRSRISLTESEQGISCKPFDAGVSAIGLEPHQRITWLLSNN